LQTEHWPLVSPLHVATNPISETSELFGLGDAAISVSFGAAKLVKLGYGEFATRALMCKNTFSQQINGYQDTP
jgi:hypothetical protein